jgi:spermidine synthase
MPLQNKFRAEPDQINFTHLLLLNLLASFCCMIYELVLAQLLSATLGDTVLRYSTTVGFYLASMGLGSLLIGGTDDSKLNKRLLQVEILLSTLGLFSPVALLLADKASRVDLFKNFYLSHVVGYGLIFFIGLVTGAELPLLMRLADKLKKSGGNLILAIDYVGTLAAAVLFPLIILPQIGVIYASFLAAAINLLLSLSLIYRLSTSKITLAYIFTLALVFFALAMFFGSYENWLIYEVYLK